MKVIIAGSRNFNNYEFLKEKIENLNIQIDEVVCGGARGADTLGKRYAIEHNIPVKEFPAEWDKFGKKAGMLRNMLMGDYADYLIAFWDGRSHGTHYMIEYMKMIGKHGRVFYYE